jgi:3-phosphoshikimate 1-carboxyvinyltransferase
LSVVCILATRASGITELTDLVGTPADEENGAAEMVELLRAFGVEAEAEPGAIRIVGRPQAPLRAAELDVRGRPDIALAATVLGLVADAPSRIERAECIVERFPRFIGTLRALGARLEVER